MIPKKWQGLLAQKEKMSLNIMLFCDFKWPTLFVTSEQYDSKFSNEDRSTDQWWNYDGQKLIIDVVGTTAAAMPMDIARNLGTKMKINNCKRNCISREDKT